VLSWARVPCPGFACKRTRRSDARRPAVPGSCARVAPARALSRPCSPAGSRRHPVWESVTVRVPLLSVQAHKPGMPGARRRWRRPAAAPARARPARPRRRRPQPPRHPAARRRRRCGATTPCRGSRRRGRAAAPRGRGAARLCRAVSPYRSSRCCRRAAPSLAVRARPPAGSPPPALPSRLLPGRLQALASHRSPFAAAALVGSRSASAGCVLAGCV